MTKEFHKELAQIFPWCIQKKLPENFNHGTIIILYKKKKGDNKDLDSYHAVTLLSNIYKSFSKILTD